MTPSPQKWSRPPNIFSPIFSKNVSFFEKIVKEMKKYSKPYFPVKKVIFIFLARRPLPFKRDLGPWNGFSLFSQKIQLFLKKLLNNKIFNTSFVIKVMLIFGPRRLFSLKNCQMRRQNSFSRCSQKNPLFSKKLNKKIFSIYFLIKKGYIHFWHKMTPDRLHGDPATLLQTKWGSSLRFLHLCSKILFFWRTSCARDL